MYHVYVDGFLRTTVRASDKTRALVEGVDCARVSVLISHHCPFMVEMNNMKGSKLNYIGNIIFILSLQCAIIKLTAATSDKCEKCYSK